jgi:hypothetical protein
MLSQHTTLNPVQLHLLQMFQFNKREESVNELKQVLYEYYRKKVDEESANLDIKYGMTNAKIEEILNSHIRTPYSLPMT